MRRIWTFVKQKVGLGIPVVATTEPPVTLPIVVPSKSLADAWVRISERQRKKAATASTLAQAQAVLFNLHGDSAKRLVLSVTTSTATTYHVRAADVLSAQANKMRDVPLCDPAGESISSTNPVRRSRVPLTDVLAGMVELLSLPEAAMPDSKPVGPATGSGIKSVEHSTEAAKYELLPEADAESTSPREHLP